MVTKKKKWILEPGIYGFKEFIYEHLLVEDQTIKAGVWNIEIRVDLHDNSAGRCKYITTETLIVYKFLVIPNKPSFESIKTSDLLSYIDYLNNIWRFSSICVKDLLYYNYKPNSRIKSCTSSAQWSTYFPDPKSSFNHQDLSIDIRNRF